MGRTTDRSQYERVATLYENFRRQGKALSGGEIARRLTAAGQRISKTAVNNHLVTLREEYASGQRIDPTSSETQLAGPARVVVGSTLPGPRPQVVAARESNSKATASTTTAPPVIAKRGQPFEPEIADLVPWLRLIKNSFPRTADENVYSAATPEEKTEASVLVSLAMAAARKHASEAAGMSFESFKARMKADAGFAGRVRRAEASGVMTLHAAGYETATLARPADRTAMVLALLRARAASDYEPSQTIKLQGEISVDERVSFEGPNGLFEPARRADLISSILAEGERQRLRAGAIDVEPIEVPALPEATEDVS